MNNSTSISQINQEINILWTSITTYLIFTMQIGFTFIHAGNVRFRFTQNTLIKKLINISINSLIWWILGLGLAFGSTSDLFIGTTLFLDEKLSGADYIKYMFHFAYAITCTAIFTGCIAERIKMIPFIIFTSILIGIIYPIPVHWCWGGGWLYDLEYHDLSGSGIIHLVAGASGLAGEILLGPRTDRFKTKNKISQQFLPSNVGFIVLGTFTMWLGWYGFNCGTVNNIIINRKIIESQTMTLVSKVAVNSTIAPSICGLIVFFLEYLENRNTHKKFSVKSFCNGILAGLVSVSASCDNIETWASFCIGLIGGLIYFYGDKLQNLLKIDDPLNGVSIHVFCGIWGSIAVGWFDEVKGIFYGNNGRQFGIQLLGCLVNFCWSFFTSLFIIFLMKISFGIRIPNEEEEIGSDILDHGGYSLIFNMDHLRIGKREITIKGKKILLEGTNKEKYIISEKSCKEDAELYKFGIKSYDFLSDELLEMKNGKKINQTTNDNQN